MMWADGHQCIQPGRNGFHTPNIDRIAKEGCSLPTTMRRIAARLVDRRLLPVRPPGVPGCPRWEYLVPAGPAGPRHHHRAGAQVSRLCHRSTDTTACARRKRLDKSSVRVRTNSVVRISKASPSFLVLGAAGIELRMRAGLDLLLAVELRPNTDLYR